ncbi:MAG: DUF2610 domain-containing protein [Bacteroidota bacterium]
MKTKRVLYTVAIFFVVTTYCLGFQGVLLSDKLVDEAYDLYRKDKFTTPSELFFTASERAKELQEKTPSPELEAVSWILSAYGNYVRSFYEYSLIMPREQRKELWRDHLKMLRELEVENFSIELKASVLNAIGIMLDRLGRYKQGFGAFKNALELEPEWPALVGNYAGALYNLGKYEEAENKFEKSIELDSFLLKSYYYLAWSYYRTNRENEAMKLGKMALQINPEYFQINNLFAGIYSSWGKTEEAKKEYMNLLKLNPNWILACTNMAFELNKEKEHEQAIIWSKKALKKDPHFSLAYLRIGNAYNSLDLRDSAIHYYNLCNAIDSSCYSDIGWMYVYDGEYSKAVDYAMLEIEADSSSTSAYNLAGWSSYYQRKDQDARKYFEKNIELDNRASSAMRGLAYTFSRLKEYEKAGETWEKLVKMDPTNKEYVKRGAYDFVNAAKKAMRGDDAEEAIKWLQKGSNLGNRFCRLFAFGLMNEFGIGVEENHEIAMESYKKGLRRIHFIWFVKDRIIKLYEANNVQMDSLDYDYWKNKLGEEKFTFFSIPCIKKNGSRENHDINIISYYPPNVHSMEWESERILEEEEAQIPDEVVKSFQKLLLLALRNNVSYSELCKYAVGQAEEEKSNSRIIELRALVGNLELQKEERRKGYKELIDIYTNQYNDDSTKSKLDILSSTTDDYIDFLLSNDEVSLAEEMSQLQIQREPVETDHFRKLARVHIKRLELIEDENVAIEFDDIFTSHHFGALGVYYRYFLGKKDKKNALKMQNRVLRKNDSPYIKYILFKSQLENDVDLFEELYLNDNSESILENIKHFEKEINKVKDEEKLELYPYMIKMDEHLLTLNDDPETITTTVRHNAEVHMLKNEIGEAEVLLLNRMKVDSTNIKIIGTLAKVHLKQYDKAKKLNAKTNFDEYLILDDSVAMLSYYDYLVDLGEEQNVLYYQEKMTKEFPSPALKFYLFEQQTKNGIDFFKELYLTNNSYIEDDISHFMGEIRKTSDNFENITLYRHLILLDEYMIETKGDSVDLKAIANHYNSYAWYQLLTGEFAESEANIYKGLKLDPTNLYFQTNLPASLLLQGRYEEAKKLYLEWKDKPFDPDERYDTFKEVYLEDIEAFKEENVIPDQYKLNVDWIVDLLKS